ncbi:hypothetical protein IU487_35950 [Nocardia puris]|uniref:hypothetical protein n=1 Tax=Nocardia puris TaxID=208602 RepID=UPI001892EC57|nr:hypothetical protein [Nocardia puris]MBF6216383.1 hypothetical protein [Nocardia puris]
MGRSCQEEAGYRVAEPFALDTGRSCKAKILLARAHSRECALVVLDPTGQMKGMDLYRGASCIGIDGLGRGRGRVTAQIYQLDATPRRGNTVTGVIRKEPRPGGQMGWAWVEPTAQVIDLPARAG